MTWKITVADPARLARMDDLPTREIEDETLVKRRESRELESHLTHLTHNHFCLDEPKWMVHSCHIQ